MVQLFCIYTGACLVRDPSHERKKEKKKNSATENQIPTSTYTRRNRQTNFRKHLDRRSRLIVSANLQPSELDEQDVRDTAGEVGTKCWVTS